MTSDIPDDFDPQGFYRDDDLEFEAFYDQLPVPRSPDGAPYDSVREEEPSPAPKASQLFEMWRETRKLCTRQTRDQYRHRTQEMEVLLEAYQTSKSLGSAGADFRDAIVDAMAEALDECGNTAYFPWSKLFAAPSTSTDMFQPLRGLCAFRFALQWYPRTSVHHDAKFKDRKFKAMWRGEFARLPEDKTVRTNREVWETFIIAGRCRFHTHASGYCWRAAVAREVSGRGIKSLI